MDSVVWPSSKLVRCLKEDVAADLLVEAWVTIYWGLSGHSTGTPPCTPMGLGGQRGLKLKVCQSAQACLILCP